MKKPVTRIWLIVSMGLLTIFAGQSVATAQDENAGGDQYESLTIAEEFQVPSEDSIDTSNREEVRRWNEERRNVLTLRRRTRTAASDLVEGKSRSLSDAELDNWINGYVIPMMGQNDEKTLSELGRARESFFRYYLEDATSDYHARIISLTVDPMKQIVEGNFHPAARVNAMIVLSQLNQREGDRSQRRLPVPLPEMLDYMIEVVRSDTLPNYLKPAALAGIERHARARTPKTNQPFSEAQVNRIGDLMVNLITAKPEQGEDPDLVHWMRKRAIRILGYVGRPGSDQRFARALKNVIFDEDLPTQMRIEAVASYGRLAFEDAANADIRAVVAEIGEILAQSAAEEAEFIERKIQDIEFTVKFLDGGVAEAADEGDSGAPGLGFGASAESGGAGGGGGGNTADKADVREVLPVYQRERVKRRFKHTAWNCRVALVGHRRYDDVTGLRDLVPDDSPEAQLIDALVKDIDDLMAGTDIREPTEEEKEDEDREPRTVSLADQLKQALARGSQQIQQTLQQMGPGGPEADTESTPADSSSPAEGTSAGQ